MNRIIDYGAQPACAIYADEPLGLAQWRDSVAAAGGRALRGGGVAEATSLLQDMADPDLVLLDLSRDGHDDLDRLLALVDERAAEGRHPAIVALATDLIDRVSALTWHDDVVLLCDPTPTERTAAVALAGATGPHALLRERGEGPPPELRRLSEEVGRIARALADLSQDEPARSTHQTFVIAPTTDMPSVATVRSIIRARRIRDQFFQADLFADPAWDMLLDLMLAHIERRTVAVSSLCIAASVPPTTALRWIKRLTEEGLFVRIADPRDGRRVFIHLAPHAVEAMATYFRAADRIVGPG